MAAVFLCLTAALMVSCAGEHPRPAGPVIGPARARALIDHALPGAVTDRQGWIADIQQGFASLAIEPTHDTVCAVVAVIEQESNFRVDPVIPNLPAIAWKEIDERAASAGVPRMIVRGVLQLKSATGRSYGDRIDSATTEKELSDIFEDFIGAVPLGHTLFADRDPIRTRGPMQVNVTYAQAYAAVKPYPYPVKISISDELFTRRGGLYFGIAHLLAYTAPYDQYRYRFADFNAGQYASRNAAFQAALSAVTGMAVVADGALLPHDAGTVGATEVAARTLAVRIDMSETAVHEALLLGKAPDFERSTLYQRVFHRADALEKHALSRAIVPRIELHSPKITRKLTTEWYTNRVNERFERCRAQ